MKIELKDFSYLQTQLEVTREENKKLYQTVKKLKQELEDYLLNESSFMDNDEKVLYYTGLGMWELLQKLFIYSSIILNLSTLVI